MRWGSLVIVAPLMLCSAEGWAQAWPAGAPPPASTAPATWWYGTPPNVPPPPPIEPARPSEVGSDGTGLMIGGALTLALYYGAAALSTAGLAEACDYQPTAAQASQLEELRQAGQLDPQQQLAVAQAAKLCDGTSLSRGYIPFAGPFLIMSSLKGTPLSVWPLSVGLASLGVGQVTGALLFLVGAVQHAHADVEPTVQVTPSVGPSSAGMSVAVRF